MCVDHGGFPKGRDRGAVLRLPCDFLFISYPRSHPTLCICMCDCVLVFRFVIIWRSRRRGRSRCRTCHELIEAGRGRTCCILIDTSPCLTNTKRKTWPSTLVPPSFFSLPISVCSFSHSRLLYVLLLLSGTPRWAVESVFHHFSCWLAIPPRAQYGATPELVPGIHSIHAEEERRQFEDMIRVCPSYGLSFRLFKLHQASVPRHICPLLRQSEQHGGRLIIKRGTQ